MKLFWLTVSLVSFHTLNVLAQVAYPELDRKMYYDAISNEDEDQIDQVIEKLEGMSFDLKDAFLGAMHMKRAGLTRGVGKKLSVFKDGHKLLEDSIGGNPGHPELRFLRLIIQEHAPAILNYNDKKEEDASAIVKAFPDMPKTLKAAVRDYSERSKTLDKSMF